MPCQTCGKEKMPKKIPDRLFKMEEFCAGYKCHAPVVCTACYGKKQLSVMSREIGGGYDSGDHIEMRDCSRCRGTGEEPASAFAPVEGKGWER